MNKFILGQDAVHLSTPTHSVHTHYTPKGNIKSTNIMGGKRKLENPEKTYTDMSITCTSTPHRQ